MSVTAAAGFTAHGVAAGIKSSGGLDVAVVINAGPRCVAAAQLTSNRFAAAPVHLTRDHVSDGQARAVVLNSGCANACTDERGLADARETAQTVAAAAGVEVGDVLVCSTGMIGEPLPMEQLLPGVREAVAGAHTEGGGAAAEAILTTDTHSKQACVSGDGYAIGGMAKGAGMLAPGLATMLVVITTDADVDAAVAQTALAEACRTTFNRLDSDGCMSTNDTVILLASGASGRTPDPDDFTESLREVCARLGRELIGDAEGASHDIAITVARAASESQAEAAARCVARSNLFKTAIFGADPNWGRIVSELGTLSEEVCAYAPEDVSVSMNGVEICRGGEVGEPRDLVDLSAREVAITIDLGAGSASATVWTNDLTHDYVEENSAYSS
ncbi:bifunctional glutamate N-acetyltransferase/amino-acid acetyltransferase ArgJ [Nanchangia anserum]|uniref:bifunctional glutamate N-acetyltransferase/amino-acid acetyltransferase ArgJ n=1 Tax=Nanchangia anserum TaxID=2692125 RepID=UPI0018839CB5|nr:bifunctional glutamate N-acetyltransferase/amino-acid acetyltransferase ArgJ [Nanchangia anserum]QOX81215.1 bifunctional glutamate N-acetyltransferase/amino-acid acetyltransferase ArgJ [Nanchangia anserum]